MIMNSPDIPEDKNAAEPIIQLSIEQSDLTDAPTTGVEVQPAATTVPELTLPPSREMIGSTATPQEIGEEIEKLKNPPNNAN